MFYEGDKVVDKTRTYLGIGTVDKISSNKDNYEVLFDLQMYIVQKNDLKLIIDYKELWRRFNNL